MKTLFRTLFFIFTLMLTAASCTKDGFGGLVFESASMSGERIGGGGGGGEGGTNGQPEGIAGKITAGEWNDLDNWPFWGDLMTPQQDGEDYAKMVMDWGFNTKWRVAVKVTDNAGKPVPGVSVHLMRGKKTLWMARTDVLGRADCWLGMFNDDSTINGLRISLDGWILPDEPKITTLDSEVMMNEYTVKATAEVQPKADLLFIVDATGSMSDEIAFLKADLMDILNKVQSMKSNIAIRTGALFYRDEGDAYLTRVSQFTDNINETISFIGKQNADGGGDYPEAVHTALEHSIQKLSWRQDARTKLAFMLLDAPAHQDQQGVVESLHKSIEYYAAQGIKLIPVASSGVDKSTEFMLRLFSIATNGTYVFITNDSGIGNDHIEPTIGEYKVEILSDLLVRLITKYLG